MILLIMLGSVFVVGDWNHWKVDADAMVKETNPEYWQSFIPEARPKQQYKYIVLFKGGIAFSCAFVIH